MKAIKYFAVFWLFTISNISAGASELYDRLIALDAVVSVEEVDKGFFNERLVVMFEQPLDHSAPAKGKFEQRIVIAHTAFDSPTLMVTDGYDAQRAVLPFFREEISRQFNTNQIFVEHRYFGESSPAPCDWKYLRATNAAADLHRIRQTLAGLYPAKWIATGTSKGGQNALIYLALYPGDVDATVTYVAPVCFAVEDRRLEDFLKSVGTKQQRDAVTDYQKEVLKRKKHLLPLFEEYCKARDYKFRLPIAEIFDYWVLEYSFAHWQRGTATSLMPDSDSPHEELFYHLVGIVQADYFSTSSEPSFFVQAARELGYYGYDTTPFKGYLSIQSAEGYLHKIFLGDDTRNIVFSRELADRVINYFQTNDPRLICVYGGTDPWTGAGLSPALFEDKYNMVRAVEPQGSHRARINTLPDEQKAKLWDMLERWIY